MPVTSAGVGVGVGVGTDESDESDESDQSDESGETEYRHLREAVRKVIADCGAATERSDSWMRGHDLDFSRRLGAAGLLGVTWPETFGGRGLPGLARLAVTEELLRRGAPVAAHWIGERQIGPAMLRYGSEEMKAEFVPRIASAELTFCLGMSETEAGSDLAAIRTVGRQVDGGWELDGAKVWTTQAHRATHAYVLARTSRESEKHAGLTEFIVDMGAPGVSVRPILDLAGQHHFNEVLLQSVVVDGSRVLGQVGNGWSQVTQQLAFERGGPERIFSTYPLLAALLGPARGAGDRAVIEQVGELAARLGALRRMAVLLTTRVDAGEAPIREAAELKYLGTQFERDVVETARYVFDVAGVVAEHRQMMDDAVLSVPGATIRGGASEVLLSIIAKAEVGR